MLIEAGATAWDQGNVQMTQKYFTTAYALGPQFTELAAYAAAGIIAVGDMAAADKILLAAYGSLNVENDILAVAYYRTKNWPRLIAMWKLRADKPNASVDTWFSLAAAYYTAGDKESAIKTINKAVALYPEAAPAGASAIAQIEGKSAGR